MLGVFSQISLLIESFYLDNERGIKTQYCMLRKRILAWLEISKTKPESDD